MQVPIDYSRDTTYEDDSIVSPEEREEHFWQKDHVRLYGTDYPERLEKAGFSVKKDKYVQEINDELREKFRLQNEEVIYFLGKEKGIHK